MRYLFARALAVAVFLAVLPLALPGRPRATADDASALRQAHHSLSEALGSGDRKAVNALLDERFEWVEANGRIHTKSEVLDDLHA